MLGKQLHATGCTENGTRKNRRNVARPAQDMREVLRSAAAFCTSRICHRTGFNAHSPALLQWIGPRHSANDAAGAHGTCACRPDRARICSRKHTVGAPILCSCITLSLFALLCQPLVLVHRALQRATHHLTARCCAPLTTSHCPLWELIPEDFQYSGESWPRRRVRIHALARQVLRAAAARRSHIVKRARAGVWLTSNARRMAC